MKVGILTLPLNTNYGGILQAFALQTVLENMGHDVCVLEKSTRKKMSCRLKDCVKTFLVKDEDRYLHEFKRNNINVRYFDSFSDAYTLNLEAIVVGSDQIWRPRYFNPIETAYLNFSKGWKIKRIAYAASFGTDNWEYTPEQTLSCAALANSFEAISVREDSAVSLCKDKFGIAASFVLDPTMLLRKEDYIQRLHLNEMSSNNGNLLVYLLDETPDKQKLVKAVKENYGLSPFSVNTATKGHRPSIQQWVKGFNDAKFVITDSFHACVFSIIFGKPFIAYGNAKRGMARFHSLLKQFGQEDNLIQNSDEFMQKPIISYMNENTGDKLKNRREYSLSFLRKALS